MARPLASIIVPTFNRLSFLVPTLHCLLRQQIGNSEYEVVVVDSGTDATEHYLKEMVACTPRLRYQKTPELRNRSHLRNTGAQIARGHLLVFVDNDMLLPPAFLQAHLDLHAGTNNRVGLGKRRSLVEFDQRKVDLDFLVTGFSRIEGLPFYHDYRDQFFAGTATTLEDTICPWRFCFSHSFSVSRELFDRAGGFNQDFGTNWGFEDVELGLRLQRAGAQFIFETTAPGYHQPHVEQSRTEQPLSTQNAQLMSRLYPSVEIELLNVFGTQMGTILRDDFDEKSDLQKEAPPELEVPENELVVAAMHRLSSISTPPIRHHLGIYLHIVDTDSIRAVTVRSVFHSLPPYLQAGILREGFRVSKKVHFEGSSEENIRYLSAFTRKMGLDLAVSRSGSVATAHRKSVSQSHVVTLVLPSPLDPKKRFAWLCLALELDERGYEVVLLDPKGKKDFATEDYRLPESETERLQTKLNSRFSYLSDRQVLSEENILMGIVSPLPNHRIVISDIGFPKIGTTLLVQNLAGAQVVDGMILSLVQSVRFSRGSKSRPASTQGQYHFVCTMSAGFDEDGIELILMAFESLYVKNPSIRLTIKAPDHIALALACFTEHNTASKKYKLQGPIKKSERDLLRLQLAARASKATQGIEIINSNWSFDQITDLLRDADCYVSATRGNVTCADILCALTLGVTTIVPEQVKVPEVVSTYYQAITYPTVEQSFSHTFDIPETSATLKLRAYTGSLEVLVIAMEAAMTSVSVPIRQAPSPIASTQLDSGVNAMIRAVFGVSRWE